MLGVRHQVTAEFMILFLNIGIQIKVDFNRLPFIFEYTQSAEADPATFLTFLGLRVRFRFNQRIKSFTHGCVLQVLLYRFRGELTAETLRAQSWKKFEFRNFCLRSL